MIKIIILQSMGQGNAKFCEKRYAGAGFFTPEN
jgi:hypothetical protein